MTRTAWFANSSYHAVQGCNVNMQFGGATSRDLARQADQYGLSLALLHQGARLLHLSTFFSYVRLAACVRGGVLGPAYLDGTNLACSLKPNSFLIITSLVDLKTAPAASAVALPGRSDRYWVYRSTLPTVHNIAPKFHACSMP